MLAGNTEHRVGTRIRVTSIDSSDAEDQDLIGLTGEITHAFPGLMWPGVKYIAGIHLDNGEKMNLTSRDSFEVLEDQSVPATVACNHG